MRLVIEDVVGGYGRIEVLHGISFTVPDSGRVGLFGPNGHGKTTLLRAISGLVSRRSGRVRFGDTDLTGASPERTIESGIVHVPQGSTLFPRMTVMEALTLGAYARHAWPSRKESSRQGARDLSQTRRTPLTALQYAERRRTADGCHRHRPDGVPAAAHA